MAENRNACVGKAVAAAGVLALACVLVTPLRAAEPSDADVSISYYRDLATRGHPYAQLTLGDIHRQGDLVPADPVEAYSWYAVAAEQGATEAVEPMQALLDSLSESERAEAEKRAAEYKRRFIPESAAE